VIEDRFLIATLIEDELADLGYTSCDIVDTEAAAIEAARVRCPDIITADDRMTTGTGIAAVKRSALVK
jgi:CheY-like chemotaxis protein